MKNKNQYRQGDVFVERVSKKQTGNKPAKGRVILAYGEVTGHAHEIADMSSVTHVEEDGDTKVARRFILSVQTELRHQEHAAITLAPGDYCVTRQREYSPEAIRNVAD